MRKRLFISLIFIITISNTFSQGYQTTIKKNYIRTWTPAVAEKDANNLVTRPASEVYQSTEYFDGLGRPLQTVMKQVSPKEKDMVNIISYDEFGRESKKFLPFTYSQTTGPNHIANDGEFKYDPFGEARMSIKTNVGSHEEDPFTRTLYDGSPLNRVVKNMDPGYHYGYSNIGVTYKQEFNKTEEKVHIWDLDYTSLTSIPETNTSTGIYTTGQLTRMITTDEKGKKIITYTDNHGKVVLKKEQDKEDGPDLSIEHAGWACTYYVYDHLGLPRFIITPKAIDYLDNNGWILSQNIVDELCFSYQYDELGRLIVSKQPGIGAEKKVYDYKDRLVLSQVATQDKVNNTALTKNQWTFILYDDLDRIIATGLLSNDDSREALQVKVNNLSNAITPITISLKEITAPGTTTTTNIMVDNPVAGTTVYIAGTTNVIYNSITHFDTYNYTGVKSFNSNYSFAYTSSTPNIDPTVKTERTTDLVTGEKVRKLDNDDNPLNDEFIFSTAYYDEKGRNIQMLTENIKLGQDYETTQFDFSGKEMSTSSSHSVPGNTTFTITSKNEYYQDGRLHTLAKKFNNSSYKILAELGYNELGQVIIKNTAPGYTGGGFTEMDVQNYSYNITGQSAGINKSDAYFGIPSRYFAEWLDYDNHNGLFNNAQYDGKITGMLWTTKGNPDRQKYDYTYDNLGRLSSAQYNYFNSGSQWSNANKDFSVFVTYEDRNGNIKSLKQMGVLYGQGVKEVDNLNYFYKSVPGIAALTGNQLIRVTDAGNMLTKNGLLGDFKDGTGTGDDYTYDANGNIVKDLNKNILDLTNPDDAKGIIYNFLDKPVKMVLKDRSTVEYVYDASGDKLSKKVTKAGGAAPVTTYYIGDFVYEDNDLTYVLHEEGRVKFIVPLNTSTVEYNAGSNGITWGSKQGVFEYFVKDHLGNTRLVLTEEVQKEFYNSSMEQANSYIEERLFGKIDINGNPAADNELAVTRVNNSTVSIPWTGNTTDFVKLTGAGSGKTVGPNLLLKVMAGDVINAQAKYFYYTNNSTSGTSGMVSNIVGSIIGALMGGNNPSGVKLNESFINTSIQTNPDFTNFINTTQPNQYTTIPPRAYLNVLFFDEQFKFIPNQGTAFQRVLNANDPNASFTPLSQNAPRNGWAFVYLSNESNEPVYFDDFYVSQIHSRLAEETNYYPHGLKIAALSSVKFARKPNTFGYQADFSEEEEESGYVEFELRNYDPQIGRWAGADPYEEFASPYIGIGNDPVNNMDEDGGEITPLGWAGISAVTAATATYVTLSAVENSSGKRIKNKALWSFSAAFVASGVGFATSDRLMKNYDYSGTMGGGSWGDDFIAFYAGMFGFSGEIQTRLCGGQIGSSATTPSFHISLPNIQIPLEFGFDQINDWRAVFKWTNTLAQSYFTWIKVDGIYVPTKNVTVPHGPADFDPKDKDNWRWERNNPMDLHFPDPGDPNTVRRGLWMDREFQIRIYDETGDHVWNMDGNRGFNRNWNVQAVPLIYNKDWKKIQRTGKTKFLKRRLKSFRFGFTIKKKVTYRRFYIKIFKWKIYFRKKCLNCQVS